MQHIYLCNIFFSFEKRISLSAITQLTEQAFIYTRNREL